MGDSLITNQDCYRKLGIICIRDSDHKLHHNTRKKAKTKSENRLLLERSILFMAWSGVFHTMDVSLAWDTFLQRLHNSVKKRALLKKKTSVIFSPPNLVTASFPSPLQDRVWNVSFRCYVIISSDRVYWLDQKANIIIQQLTSFI